MRRWALLAILLAGCDRDFSPPPSPDQVKDPRQLYAENCAACHGADGRWGPAPPLNDPLFLSIVSDEKLRQVTKEGRQGTLMPGFCTDKGGRVQAPPPGSTAPAKLLPGPLTPRQIDILVDHMRTWGKLDPQLASYAAILKDQMEGDSKRGQALYQKACATCHGDQGQGVQGKAGTLNDPAFLALVSPAGLRRIIFTGRPHDLKMPDYRGTASRAEDFQPLSPQDIADVAALLLSWRK